MSKAFPLTPIEANRIFQQIITRLPESISKRGFSVNFAKPDAEKLFDDLEHIGYNREAVIDTLKANSILIDKGNEYEVNLLNLRSIQNDGPRL